MPPGVRPIGRCESGGGIFGERPLLVTNGLTGYQAANMLRSVKLEEALVQLARLGLKGDSASVGRLIRKLLREYADDAAVPMRMKEALADLVASQPSPMMRFAEPASTAAASPYLRLEMAVDGDGPLLAPDVESQLSAIANEHKHRERLESAGLEPTRTILLTGVPGVGKTMAARSLARRLGLPLLAIDLSALMSSYLGKTGQNLRDVFVAARAEPSVLLLDEFDAVAKRRDDPSDVGELKRIVNVLLIELETHAPAGLVVAATNHPELLDRAIWRRFERVVNLGLPTSDVRRALLTRELARLPQPPSGACVDAAVAATDGASCSDTVVLARTCVRRVVLDEEDPNLVLARESIDRLRGIALNEPRVRGLYACLASAHLGRTQRAIGNELGISHVMVGKLMKQAERGRNAEGGQDHV